MPDCMTRYSLYYSRYCYFCQKVLMVLRNRQHPIELRNINEQENSAALLTGGGKRQVPCLRIESADQDEQWMYESNDIIHYIREQGLLA